MIVRIAGKKFVCSVAFPYTRRDFRYDTENGTMCRRFLYNYRSWVRLFADVMNGSLEFVVTEFGVPQVFIRVTAESTLR